MTRRTLTLLLTVSLALVGVFGTGVAAGAATTPKCPSSTTATKGLCVAKGAAARDVADAVQSTFTDASLGAVVVGVWKAGKPLVVGALGDSMTGVPATVAMHHRVGNISAAMLTTVLLQQVEKGTLSLSDPISKWFPDLPSADQITVQMLANSTSGYRHYTELPSFQAAYYANPFRHWNTDDLIAYGVAGGPLFTPGTDFHFSDTNLLILGRILEQATGTSVAKLIQRGVLDRLGMKNTTPPITARLPEPVLHSHTDERGVWEEATYWDPSWTVYAGGMGSNQADLRTFLEAVGKGTLLSKKMHELQLAQPTGLANSSPDRYYAFGLGGVNGWIFTNPALQGYRGALGYFPGQQLTVVIYTTYSPKSDENVAQATQLFEQISQILTPDNVIQLPS